MKINILDLVDFEKVDTLLEGFNKSTGFVTAILDLNGKVLSKSGWRQICTEFHRIHPETAKKCTISDTVLAGELVADEKYHYYKCLNGLVDVAVPIVIKGEHIANLFSGQFFFEKPDTSFFQKQARKYGFNESDYMKALVDVPIISEEKVKPIMEFLQNMTQLISEMALQKLEQMELNDIIHKREKILKLFVENSPASIAMFDNNMHYLVASHRFLADYNLGDQNLIGRSHYEVFPEISERWKNFHRRGLAGEILKEDNDLFPRVDGKTDWVRWEIRPWYESDDHIGGIILFSEVITAQIEDREALKESEKYNRMLFEQSAIGLVLTSLDGKLIDINLTCANIIGRTIEEAKELTYWEITPEKYLGQEQQQLKNLDEIGYYGPYEKEYIHKDGHFVPVRLQGKIIERAGVKYIWSSVEDITVRKQAEENILKIDRLYAVISQINKTIVRTSDRDKLFKEVCEIVIKYGKFQMSWIGLVDEETNLVNPASFAGIEDGYFSKIKMISISGAPEGRGPIGTAIKEGKHYVCNDIENDPNMAPWKREALKRGYRSLMALPIKLFEKVIGAFGLYSSATHFFDKEEIDLLDEVTNDISFALEAIETEKKRQKAEEALRESETKYQSLFKDHPQPMWIYDVDSLKFLEVNEAATINYGYTKEEFLTMSLKDIRPEEDIPTLLNNIETHNKVYQIDESFRHKKKDGTLINVNISSHKINFSDNKNYRLVMAIDITDQYNAQKELLKLSHAVEQSPVSIVITDTDGNIEYGNPKVTQITGYKPEEIIGKNSRIFNSGEKPKSEYQILWDTISSGNEWFGEFHNKKKNGELYWEYASISPIMNKNGEIINYIAIKEDISQQKDLIQELVQAKEKAEESDRLKSAFLANMSHEIRTPMNGILGFTELLLEPDLSSEQKEVYINIVRQSGQRMLNTVNDIVEISKIEAGIVTVDLKEVNVQKQINELIRFFTPEATKKGLKLILEKEAPKSAAIITTDQNKLDSILTNLIKNAIKYTDKGSIEIGYEITAMEHAPRLQFYVKDTGIGITKERQEAIFERFIQADIVDKDARQGSGLGLAITKAYVEMLGGEIWVESKAGEGSAFLFTLPLSAKVSEKTVEKETSIPDDKSNQRKGLNILIAEDDETSALYLQTILQSENCKFILTQSGTETVEACRNNPDIDLVLMDIQMPGMNGYDATREIRKFNKNVIIIAQTAFALEGDNVKALEAGCNDYIAKPIKKDELFGIIEKYLI